MAYETPNARLHSGSHIALAGALVNSVLAVAKMAAGYYGNSYALIADGIESTLDIFGSVVVWAGLRYAAIPPDESHPYGHGKAETLATIIVAFSLIGTSILLTVQSVKEILNPHHAPHPFTLGVLLTVVLIKEFLFRKVINHSAELKSAALESDAWHHRSDAITSVAAFLGISVALIGGKGFEAADSYAALVACGFIGFNGFRILIPALGEAMDTAPSPHIAEAVRLTAATVPGVGGIEKCKVRKMGVEFYVDLHVMVEADLTVREGHAIAHAVKDSLRDKLPAIADVLVHIEPIEPPKSPH